MSCIQISFETLAGVRETIESSLFWTSDYQETPTCIFSVFFPNSSRFNIAGNRVKEKAAEFVAQALLFNHMELDRNGETPEHYQTWLQALTEFNGKRPNIMQFYKSMQFIDYNTDVRGQMTDKEYQAWPMREQYEKFHETCERVCNRLAERFVSKMPEYEKAEWG